MKVFKESKYYGMDLRMQMEEGTIDPKWLAETFIDYLSDAELEKFMGCMYIMTMDDLAELERE